MGMLTRDPDRNWKMLLIMIYSLAFFFLFVVVLVTGYSLSHPELGLTESNPFISSMISKYGLAIGIFLGVLSSVWLPLLLWVSFLVYLKACSKYDITNILLDCLMYSVLSSYGLAMLFFYLTDTANDVSWLLFHRSSFAAASLMDILTNLFILTFVVSLCIFPVLYYLTRRRTH